MLNKSIGNLRIAPCALILAMLLCGLRAGAEERIRFVALGDLPYGPPELVHEPYADLIDRINTIPHEFVIHVGDIKSTLTLCSDDAYVQQRQFLKRFQAPLLYTPGDNEWTDCHLETSGSYDPIERLAKLRQLFFTGPDALAKPFSHSQSQPEVDDFFARYPENQRFIYKDVMLLSIHLVGANNNRDPGNDAAMAEVTARDRANIAWLRDSFRLAKENSVRAMIIATHADIFQSAVPGAMFPLNSGFIHVVRDTLLPLVEDFAKPVLLIHGDSHRLRIDRPFYSQNGPLLANLMRLQVFGNNHMHAILVEFGIDSAMPFAFTPIFGATIKRPE